MSASLGKVITEGMAWASASAVLLRVIGIVYIILVLGHLSVYEYGVVELLISIPPLMSILNLPGLEQVILADLGRERGAGNRKKMFYIMESYLTLRLPLAILSWAILFFAAPLIEQYYNQAISDMLRLISFTFLWGPIRTAVQLTFKLGLKYQFQASHRLAEEVGKLAVVSYCLLVLDLSAVGVIWGYILADVIGLAAVSVAFSKTWSEVFGRYEYTGGWKEPFFTVKHHGKWSIFSSYLHNFVQNVRPWIIKFFLGTNAVGIFAVAYGMFQNTLALVPVSQVVTPIIPQYFEQKKRLYLLLNSTVKYHLFISIVVGLAMVAFMPILIYFFFPNYASAYPLFVAMLLSAIPSTLSSVYQPVFAALKAQRNLFVSNILRLISVVVTLPIAIYFLGFYGIALELFLTAALYSYNRYRKLHELLPDYQYDFHTLVSVTETDRLLYRMLSQRIGWLLGFIKIRS